MKKDPKAAQRELLEESSRMSRLYRRLETCGKPFVVCIHGTCMGGATELALAATAASWPTTRRRRSRCRR